MNLQNKILVACSCLFFFLQSSFASNVDDHLFFSKDLSVEAQGANANLQKVSNDEVRANVVRFIKHKEAYQIFDNQRDSAISVAVWIKPQNVETHSGTIIAEDSLFYFRYLSDRRIQFNHYLKKDINTEAVISEGIWQHLGFTLDAKGLLQIYLNGDVLLRDTISSDWWQNKRELLLGKDRYGVDAEGYIDDVMIWRGALSESEMHLAYKQSYLKPGLRNGLVCYLPLADSFLDFTGNTVLQGENTSMSFVQSEKRGSVLRISKNAGGVQMAGFSFDNQMTLSVWIKPEPLKNTMGLIGNRDFSFRYLPKSQRLWFSIPMVFECKSTPFTMPSDDWVNVAISVTYNHKVDFFVNGKLHDTKRIHGKTGNEGILLLGESIWEDQYVGLMSKVAVWDRALSESEIWEVYNDRLNLTLSDSSEFKLSKLFPLLVLVLLIIGVLLYDRKRVHSNDYSANLNDERRDTLPRKNAIYLLGNFEAWDAKGEDVSAQFSPVLIRLFSLVYLYPVLYKRNITSHELSDILWESDSAMQQKNSRSTNIHRLRQILDRFDGIELHYSNKQWQLQFPKTAFLDIDYYNRNVENTPLVDDIRDLKLCKPLQADVLDSIVASFNEQNVELLHRLCRELNVKTQGAELRSNAERWLSIDSLSDEALDYLLKALFYNRRKQKALLVYSRFCTNYKRLLNESYRWSFEDCINGKNLKST